MGEISSTGDQMLQLLELIAVEGPRTTAELASAAGINRTVTHRLINTLHGRGYVVRQGKGFILGPVFEQMAGRGQFESLMRTVQPIMRDLCETLGETVVLHRMDGDAAVVVDQAISDRHLVRVHHREGSRHSLTVGASGRAILAFQPPAFQKRLISQCADPEALVAKLKSVVEEGFSRSQNELQQGVVGAAIPLEDLNGVVAFSLAVLLPIQRAEHLEVAIPALLKARSALGAELRRNSGKLSSAAVHA